MSSSVKLQSIRKEGAANADKVGDQSCPDESEAQLTSAPDKDLARNRSLYTLLFQSLAIAAVPYGEGSPLISAIYGGGQLSIFLGWIIVCILYECVAISIAEMAPRYPTSAGPSFWSSQLAQSNKQVAAYFTGWIWLIGCLSG